MLYYFSMEKKQYITPIFSFNFIIDEIEVYTLYLVYIKHRRKQCSERYTKKPKSEKSIFMK